MKAIRIYDIGDVVELEATLTDPKTEEPLEPATVTCTVNSPKAAKTTPSVTNKGKGVYAADVEADEAGTWRYAFDGKGGHQGSEEGAFKVRARRVTR